MKNSSGKHRNQFCKTAINPNLYKLLLLLEEVLQAQDGNHRLLDNTVETVPVIPEEHLTWPFWLKSRTFKGRLNFYQMFLWEKNPTNSDAVSHYCYRAAVPSPVSFSSFSLTLSVQSKSKLPWLLQDPFRHQLLSNISHNSALHQHAARTLKLLVPRCLCMTVNNKRLFNLTLKKQNKNQWDGQVLTTSKPNSQVL